MTKINNMSDLRDYALETINDLRSKKIEVNEGLAISKLIDTTISTLKIEIDYSRATGDAPNIPFLKNSDNKLMIEGKAIKHLSNKK